MNIYVGNLSLDMTEDELRKEFMAYGEVVSATIMNDKYIGSGQPRGYGYVEMASKLDGRKAINNLTGKIIKNRTINVIEALPLSEKITADSGIINGKNRSNKPRRRKTKAFESPPYRHLT